MKLPRRNPTHPDLVRRAKVLRGLSASGLLHVVEGVAKDERVSVAALVSRDRTRKVARARRRALAVVRWSTGLSYPEIGHLFALDHTTVHEAVRVRQRELDAEYALPEAS